MPSGLKLERHPESQGGGDLGLEVNAFRDRAGRLRLQYTVAGDMEGVVIPPKLVAQRADELWRHTCMEAFVLREGGGYYEFNLAPSGRWAAYRFDAYREGMGPADPLPTPSISSRAARDRYELRADIDLNGVPELPSGAWLLSLTAVLEHTDGGRSYWALAHPAGKPDFHHPDSFVLELPAPA